MTARPVAPHEFADVLAGPLEATSDDVIAVAARPYLGCVHVAASSSRIVLTGADGWMLIQAAIAMPVGLVAPHAAWLPRAECAALLRALRAASRKATLFLTVQSAEWHFTGMKAPMTIAGAPIEKAPNYETLFTQTSPERPSAMFDPTLVARATRYAPAPTVRLEMAGITLRVIANDYRALVMGQTVRHVNPSATSFVWGAL